MPAISESKIMDARTFWNAIGVRAIGAAVVTASDERGPAGFLALSPTHLSANPPLMMVAIDTSTSALSTVIRAKHFAINYLGKGGETLADSFGGRGPLTGTARFEPGRWTILTTGAPILNQGVGALDCVLEETIERSGTVIAIGRLVDFVIYPGCDPLISFGGRFI